MPNKSYLKGYRRERQLVNEARAKGFISFSSRGSHSPIDLVIIDVSTRKIQFIQVKNKKVYGKEQICKRADKLAWIQTNRSRIYPR